jgi:hypothetical protein
MRIRNCHYLYVMGLKEFALMLRKSENNTQKQFTFNLTKLYSYEKFKRLIVFY